MDSLNLLKLALAAWYISYAVTNTFGPFQIFVRLREWRQGYWHGRGKIPTAISVNPNEMQYEPVKDGLLDCIICLMPWVAAVFYFIGASVITDIFAVAGIALMLHGFTGWRHNFS